jgi:pyridoxamine 5'-phosphate oxidase
LGRASGKIRRNLVTDPLDLFQAWYAQAEAASVPQPEAMALATASPDGRPSLRFVLYRGRSGPGLRFFTNYQSRKAEELLANPVAAATFYWQPLARQVRLEGPVERLDDAQSDAYWATRPRGSQLAAWASPQSQPFRYAELEQRYAALEREHDGRPVPRPPHWGGFLLIPTRIEFWEGLEFRLHKRVLYTVVPGGWAATELGP